ncbi:serine/threonine-protein kinase fused-like [Coccinella septempunctata]|uniref:serine/threonine-protein kinase fused-like n=1 Tax=Coccinella septempunctata TaxID=41139 RepID=UPI001D06D955|nr:serine/threonine-protein kinase fused-like [Coccinella septempunctata]
MDQYEVLGSLGEGSFGRVYKAKHLSNGQIVALKVISKRGRSLKEIKDLRGEFEIQRHLHHPNIIQMLDSFESDNEIVVITEFAHKALNTILGENGYLAEDRVQKIVWDLVSALYYLHSHRVLHRDLKPQNILLDTKEHAKLCDFGFARNMSTGTHVLTSIKGTPLYMAPELIDELPYDHNADLWSLGCIIYELLVGAPPFCTSSILHLIRLIKHEQIQWPSFLSSICVSFLKGLLQKDPKKRFSWTELLNHPWVKGNILVLGDDLTKPLTKTLSMNTMTLKDIQRKERTSQKSGDRVSEENEVKKNTPKSPKGSEKSECENLDAENNNAEISDKMDRLSLDSKEEDINVHETQNKDCRAKQDKKCDSNTDTDLQSSKSHNRVTPLKFSEETHPIQTEEWSVFLRKATAEIMSQELAYLTQSHLTSILVSPLKNSTTSPEVLTHIAKLMSIPFSTKNFPKKTLETIMKVYLEVKVVPNLVYSSKLLLREKNPTSDCKERYKLILHWTEDDLGVLSSFYILISHLVHLEEEFLSQFCDTLAILNIFSLLRKFLSLSKRKPRVVLDVVNILTLMIWKSTTYSELVEKILTNDVGNEENPFNFVNLLRHENALLRERVCYFMFFLGKKCPKNLELLWDDNVKETLEALMFDSIGSVRNAAERCVDELKMMEFYK